MATTLARRISILSARRTKKLFLSLEIAKEVPVTCSWVTLSRNFYNRPAVDLQTLCLKDNSQIQKNRECFHKKVSYSTQATEKTTQSSDVLFSLVTVKVKGSDQTVLDSYVQFVTRAAKVLNLDISGRIVLPIKIERHTLLKSPHIYKKHRVQYEIRTYGRMLQLRCLTGQTSDVLLEYIQRNLPEGVSMSVEHTALEEMPEYLEIPPQAKAFLAQQGNSVSSSSTVSATESS